MPFYILKYLNNNCLVIFIGITGLGNQILSKFYHRFTSESLIVTYQCVVIANGALIWCA